MAHVRICPETGLPMICGVRALSADLQGAECHDRYARLVSRGIG